MPRSGFAGAVTCSPAACRCSMTPVQLEAAAKAPWTRTTVRGAVSVAVADMRAPWLVGTNVDDSFGEGFRSFLRKVVSDAALDHSVRIFARELLGVDTRLGMWRTVGVALEGDRGHGDDRGFGEPIFQRGVFGLPFSQPQPPAIVVDDDVAVVGVVE